MKPVFEVVAVPLSVARASAHAAINAYSEAGDVVLEFPRARSADETVRLITVFAAEVGLMNVSGSHENGRTVLRIRQSAFERAFAA